MNCRNRRQRPAPSAERIANSFCRESARASRRLARFAHAISSTKPTAPWSTQRARRRPPTTSSCRPSSRSRWFFWSGTCVFGFSTAHCASIDSTSALAWLAATPCFKRPTRYRKCPPRLPGAGRIEREWQPDLHLRVVNVVARRHDAHDPRRNAVDLDNPRRRPTPRSRTPTARSRTRAPQRLRRRGACQPG